ncbi:ATP-binding protein [Qipengyuania aquimaris]|uniref:hybrid sensor histidine kinase/response regulator n=1 Tax=Qipengyuania aquimaris TaxID=255984 RepID=UPI001CD224C7|nr:ATP-binding protein [Qipengyuania aquimaris]MCA0903009.1 MASE1 domain-containing protein [Qipengyuania aquimaris]
MPNLRGDAAIASLPSPIALYKGRFRPDGTTLIACIFGFLAFATLAFVSIELTRGDGRIAVVWLPNALAASILLRMKFRNERILLAALFAGNVTANLFVGDTLSTALILSSANITEIVIALWLVRKFASPRPTMEDTRDLVVFVLGAGLVAPLVSATVASLALAGAGNASFSGVMQWAAADALSMVIIAPAVLVLWDAISNPRLPTRKEALEWATLTALGTSVTLIVFLQTSYPLLFLVPPIIISHAFRLGALGTAFSVFKVATIAVIATQMGYGPINLLPMPLHSQLIVLEAFLASSVLVGFPVAAVLSTRERLTEEIINSRKHLALLAQNITDAILRYDLHGVCTYASPSVSRVLGAPPKEFVGMTTGERVHPEAREEVAGVEERLLSGKSKSERFTYRRFLDSEDGSPVYIEADCALAFDHATGEREGIVVSARDVTERVELERKLKRATRHAENAARAKAQFLANMSHEIRTPMNGVLGFADLLARMELDPEAERYAELIARSGRSMMMLLNDILDISKIESGQLVINYETFDLPRLVEDCVRLHMAGAERKGIELAASCPDNIPRQIQSDPLRLRQVLLNLIGNAVKFTESGAVTVSVLQEGSRLAISVEDSGIGIDPKRLDRIFDPFIQEEASTTRRYGGTGLGLSISRQLAELLGGSLTVDSMPGVGSRFTLRIPLQEVDQDLDDPAMEERRAGNRFAPPPSASVLLAEDHDVNRMLVTAMLEQLGQRVTVAHDGSEAVKMALDAAESDAPFDLVLMDIQMPGCDGYTATRTIRSHGVGLSQLPIIALTANAFPEDIAAAQEAGMQGHLAKPLVFEELTAVLARWLPVRIVPEDAGSLLPHPSSAPARKPSSELLERWNARRSEALAAVTAAVEQDVLEGVHIEELARTVHKLAGTAGMFGEEALGEKAAALERALRSGVEPIVRKKLAEELLATA